ncbi:dynein intermediate chain 2, ciliary [Neocloeon triangulifer]|uniref:dynein intermediate chain 2, ciliary n=1 Tax=Neocloeon triangulifer TaxID=2078957 RepID=UPI00286EBBB0|nr:dynein intermediate chain 2, ciliary [Neocloeon triangulifer]
MQCSDPIEIKSALAQIGTTGSEEKVEEEEEPEVDGEGGAEEAPAEKHDEPLAEVIEKPPEPVAPVAVPVAISSNPPKKLTNQFNFCERGSLTLNNPSREVSTQTNPPSRITFSASITQWAIYDAYMEDHEQQEMKEKEKKEKEKEKATLAPQKKEQEAKKQEGVQEKSKFTSPEKAAKILERMSNQNTYDEIIQDFKYWEDPSDEFKEEEGTLLPLWKFSCDKAQNYSVTSICWNENCPDIFVAGYGSFDFKRRKAGLMCVYTMKNPSYPEHLVAVKSEVLAVDIHMTCTSLIVLGLSDGNIAVFDLTKSCETPLHTSNSVNNKHSAAVWQVRWSKELSQTEMTIYSISADGQVLSWTLMQNEMIKMKLISLTFSTGMIHSDDSCPLTGCGTALTFHPTENNIFLVGTEEGRIYKCSTAYTSIFLSESEAHYMPVQQVDFNRFNPAVYASCSGDWRVKIWEDNRKEPLFEFDLGSPVEDVAWAPYSSTVLAAATADGRVHVFDLNVNKYRPLCQQVVTQKKKCKLTKVSFNPKHSMLIVGDSFGGVSSVKMSPNLRKKQKPPKKGMIVDHETLEKLKLDKLLSLVREPNKPLMVLETESNAN